MQVHMEQNGTSDVSNILLRLSLKTVSGKLEKYVVKVFKKDLNYVYCCPVRGDTNFVLPIKEYKITWWFERLQ